MKHWIGPGFFVGFVITGFLWLIGLPVIYINRIERDFREACAKVNGTAVWNSRYWECFEMKGDSIKSPTNK